MGLNLQGFQMGLPCMASVNVRQAFSGPTYGATLTTSPLLVLDTTVDEVSLEALTVCMQGNQTMYDILASYLNIKIMLETSQQSMRDNKFIWSVESTQCPSALETI